MTSDLPLSGRRALVTGASRRRGIGFAVARRLVADGADVVLHHHTPHDAEVHGWAESTNDLIAELAELRDGARIGELAADLADAEPRSVVADAADRVGGPLDILICNHTHGGDDVSLASLTPQALDRHWQVSTRATLLLTQAFAGQHQRGRPGRVVWMTSGQGLGPMSSNLAYVTAKAALAGATWSVADELVDAGILLNTVNPGPVNTGYLDDAPAEFVDAFPAGRIGEPDDPARLIAWLVSDEGRWVVGQVLNTEGGFRR